MILFEASILPVVDLAPLDADLLAPDGRIRLLPAAHYARYPLAVLRVWCSLRARYAIPTVELIAWLKSEIRDRTALEIGSGNGDVGYHAGIRETDSFVQQTTEVLAFYNIMQQAPTAPPPAVEKIDALDAIRQHRPQVVVAAWVTRKYDPLRDGSGAQASIHGVDEDALLDLPGVETYIHIGSEPVHAQKTILRRPHRTVKLPGLLSRTSDPSSNVIWIWDH